MKRVSGFGSFLLAALALAPLPRALAHEQRDHATLGRGDATAVVTLEGRTKYRLAKVDVARTALATGQKVFVVYRHDGARKLAIQVSVE